MKLYKKDILFLYNNFTDSEVNKSNFEIDLKNLNKTFNENVVIWLENLGWSQENIKKDKNRYMRVKYVFESLLFNKQLKEIVE